MHEPTIIKRLLARLLATRARRDREERHTEPWNAADAELHAIERAIFRLPADPVTDGESDEPRRRHRRPGARMTRATRRRAAGRGPAGDGERLARAEADVEEPA
jgi:hypothetical protein